MLRSGWHAAPAGARHGQQHCALRSTVVQTPQPRRLRPLLAAHQPAQQLLTSWSTISSPCIHRRSRQPQWPWPWSARRNAATRASGRSGPSSSGGDGDEEDFDAFLAGEDAGLLDDGDDGEDFDLAGLEGVDPEQLLRFKDAAAEEGLNLDEDLPDLPEDDAAQEEPAQAAWQQRQQQRQPLAQEEQEGVAEEQEEEVQMDEEGKYRLRPQRLLAIADLFGMAAFYDMAKQLDEQYPHVGISGLQSDVARVKENDFYCCPSTDAEEVPFLAAQARLAGASALLLPDVAKDLPAMADVAPEGGPTPVFFVENVDVAAARLAVAFYEAPSREMLMIGVLGTHGKTTTAWLIRGILEEMGQLTGMVSSVEVALAEDRLDEQGELWAPQEPDPTLERESSAPFMVTPYPASSKYNVPPAGGLTGLQTQQVFAGIRERGGTCCVYEAPLDAVWSGLTTFVDLGLVVHTSLGGVRTAGAAKAGGAAGGAAGEEQQEEDEAEEAIAGALEPFDRLVDPQAQAAVVNLDDPHAQRVLDAASSVPCITYALAADKGADVWAESVSFDIWESEVIVRTPLGRLQIITSLLGRHNVHNILAAVATGLALKVPLKSIVAGIEAVEVIPGRSEVVDEGQDFSVVIDSASTPQALENMLSAVRSGSGRVITVFGCKGEEDKALRPLMAEVAHTLSDMVIITNDSPRREPPESIVQDIVAGLPDSIIKRYSGYVYFPFQDQGHVPLWFEPYLQKAQRTTQRYVMEDRFSAIRAAIGTAAPGDVVVLAGRGHCDFMEYDDGQGGIVRGWFDDRQEVRAALSKLAYLNQLTKLDRRTLPWGKALDEHDSLIDPPEVQPERDGVGEVPAGAGATDRQREATPV